MLIALTITVDLGDEYDDEKDMPDIVANGMHNLLAQMENCAAKCHLVESIHDQIWEEV